MAASTRPQGREPGEPRDLTALRLVLERAIRSRCFGLLASARDDLVQNALVRILERNRHEELGRRGTSYVWKVAQSVIVDELRRLGRERRLAENVSKERRPWVDPAEGIQLRQCLERLEERRRMAVTLHLSGLRIPEIARAARWTEKTAENLIYRGLDDLRALLGETRR
jgi:RNA polymerase sigma factor (sigma-70 family)